MVKRRSNVINPADLMERETADTEANLDFDYAFQTFIKNCRIRNLSEYTIQYYQDKLTEFKSWLVNTGRDTSPSTITLQDIQQTVIIPQMDRGLQESSINNRLRAIRAFFNFLYNNGYIAKNPVENLKMVKEQKKVVNSLTKEQVNLLFTQPDITTFTGFRDYTILTLLLECGIRVRGLTDIRIDDINLNDGYVKIRGKNGSERHVPVQNRMKQQLRKYLKLRGEVGNDYLFITIEENPLTKRQVQQRIRDYGKKAGIKNVRVSPHTVRHTFAKFYVQNGGDPFSLRQILGHNSFEMVNRYVNMFSNEIGKQHQKYSPLERMF